MGHEKELMPGPLWGGATYRDAGEAGPAAGAAAGGEGGTGTGRGGSRDAALLAEHGRVAGTLLGATRTAGA